MKSKIYFLLALFIFLIPSATFAADFIGLVGIPGIEPNGDTDLNAYINALYRLSISLAALLAVIKIVAAGAKYMLTDIVTSKEDAKKDIQGALIGLLIVIGAIIILNTVNSDLTRLNLDITTTTVKQNPMTVEQLIALQQRTFEEKAAADKADVGRWSCAGNLKSFFLDYKDGREDETDQQTCARVCKEIYNGKFTSGAYIEQSTCDYNDAVAQQCNPQETWFCCSQVKGGTWGWAGQQLTELALGTGRNCNFLEQSTINRKNKCIIQKRLWKGSDATGYCSTQRLPPAPTDAEAETGRIEELNRQMSECVSPMRWDALTAACVSANDVPPIM